MTFMRGQMDKRNRQGGQLEGGQATLVWKASAVVDDDSIRFAHDLELLLNQRSAEGFVLANIIQRPVDNGLVLVHQKYTVVQDSTEEGSKPAPGAN